MLRADEPALLVGLRPAQRFVLVPGTGEQHRLAAGLDRDEPAAAHRGDRHAVPLQHLVHEAHVASAHHELQHGVVHQGHLLALEAGKFAREHREHQRLGLAHLVPARHHVEHGDERRPLGHEVVVHGAVESAHERLGDGQAELGLVVGRDPVGLIMGDATQTRIEREVAHCERPSVVALAYA